MEFKKRSIADEPRAPEKLEAVQFLVMDGFAGKLALLEFVKKGLSITIYADCLLAKTDQGNVKVAHGDWIMKAGQNWYFLDDETFRRTYEPVETASRVS